MSVSRQYDFSILRDPKDIEEFEAGIYSSFIIRSPDQWMKDNYIHIDNKRLRAPFSYSFMLIFGIKKDDKLVGGLSLNFDNNNPTQYEILGFNVPNKQNSCEALNLYFTPDINCVFHVLTIFDYVIEQIRNWDIHRIYCTCNEEKLAFFKFLNFTYIDETMAGDKKEYLLELDIR